MITDLYLYPNTSEVCPLEYDWQGYQDVQVFATSDSFSQVAAWYQKLSPDCEQYDLDEGLLEIYFYTEEGDQIGNVLAADVTSKQASDYFRSYIASKIVNRMLVTEKATVVGIRFLSSPSTPKAKQ